MSAPLRDLTNGLLKSWPGGGIHRDGRYEPTFRPAGPAEQTWATVLRSSKRWVYCKYCRRSTQPVILREEIPDLAPAASEMTLCSVCAYGLTPPRPAGNGAA